MFLMNHKMISAHIEANDLGIGNFSNECLHQSYYYFRLGHRYQRWDSDKNVFQDFVDGTDAICIPPSGYALVESYESFTLSDRVYATISQISDLVLTGLRLNHSNSIDPYFSGKLRMGLQNMLTVPVTISPLSCIGKILFFNILDSRPILRPDQTMSKDKYAQRQKDNGPEAIGYHHWE
jgi:deoxycytidine triphosphate deaminase